MDQLVLVAAVTVLLYMLIIFIYAQFIKNNSIVDAGWGIGFFLITAVLSLKKENANSQETILLVLITVWAVRLSVHIWLRARGKGEDFRYAQWRKDWGKHAVVNAFFKVFMLQGVIMLVIAFPILVVFNSAHIWSAELLVAGSVVYAAGVIIEGISDYQLLAFKLDGGNAGKIITTGLWKYSRHPNYFGETLVWWGIGIFAFGVSMNWLSFISPLVLNLLLLKVSGIPLLEKKYNGNPEWDAYKKLTPAFIPVFGKKN